MKTIALLLSSYSQSNPSQAEQKEKADAYASENNVIEARRIYKQLREPGSEFLLNQFEDLKSKITIESAIGMFCGELEPSTMLGIEFSSEAEWLAHVNIVKRRMIEFGEHFSQLNVHLVDLYATHPAGVEYGHSPLDSDVSFQRKLWIQLKNLRPNVFDNYSILKQVADEAGLLNLTLHDSATSLLVYSVLDGNPDELTEFEQACDKLKTILLDRGMVFRIKDNDDVALTNYGVEPPEGFRQTHSYAVAKRFLDAEADVTGR